METVTITLNGVEVSGQPGMTVLDLAREVGVDVPTLCYDANLAPYGACRLCIVEEEKSGALLASCVTPIRSGMVINTKSPRVLDRRRTLVKLMLASHPDTCMVCDKGNQCDLRRIAADLGVGWIDLHRLPQPHVTQEVNPFIERDLSKCILCAKCIRADQELVVEGAIDYFHRGFATKPATCGDGPLEQSECTFCGTCVAMCPTGALAEREKLYRGATSEAVVTVCPFCGCGCQVRLELKDGRIVRVRPGPDGAVNRGALCVRGSYGYDSVASPDRLASPLVRGEGGLAKASWDAALALAAERLRQVIEKHGPDSVAIIGSAKCTNEESYLLQKFARAALGTNNIDSGGSVAGAPYTSILLPAFGVAGSTDGLDGLEKSDVILVAGADVTTSAPLAGYAIKRAVRQRKATLIIIDPRRTRLAAFAHLWLRPRLGSDVALLNGLARVVVDEGLFDRDSLLSRADGFDAFVKGLSRYGIDDVVKVTGLTAEEVRTAARLLAGATRAAIVVGNGVTQQTGTWGVAALANLALLTGRVGDGRGAMYALRRENNAQGACDMGVTPDYLPGYQSVTDPATRARFEARWGRRLPGEPGVTALKMMELVRSGKIKGMLIVGENPALSFPGAAEVKEALSALDVLVVSDLYLTETARLATVVLPAASAAEKDGTFTNFEGRLQRARRAVKPPGEAWPDSRIVQELAGRMGYPMAYASVENVIDEIRDVAPAYRRVRYADLEARGHVWVEWDGERGRSGEVRLAGKSGRFQPVDQPALPLPSGEYPVRLLTGSVLFHFGTGSRSTRAWRLKKFAPQAFVELAVADAGKYGIAEGDRVNVVSLAGRLTLAARVSESLRPGVCFVPASYPDTPVNVLFGPGAGTNGSWLKSCAVRLEKVAGNG